MDREQTNVAPIAVALLILSPLIAYPATYLATGSPIDSEPRRIARVRSYPANWMAVLFAPAAAVESVVIGRKVVLIVDERR